MYVNQSIKTTRSNMLLVVGIVRIRSDRWSSVSRYNLSKL